MICSPAGHTVPFLSSLLLSLLYLCSLFCLCSFPSQKMNRGIIAWLAHRVQRPGDKINHALVLGSSKQGIGKDALLEPVKEVVGRWNFQDISPKDLLGRFNAFAKAFPPAHPGTGGLVCRRRP